MSKQVKSIIAVLIVLVVLVGALLLLTQLGGESSSSSSSSAQSTAVTLLDKQVNDIKSVEIKNPTSQYTVERRENEQAPWTIEAVKDLPTDNAAFTSTLQACALLRASRLVEENPADLSAYGLNAPSYQIKINYNDNSMASFVVGASTPGAEGFYGMLEGDPKIYLLPNSLQSLLALDPKDYVSTTLYTTEDTSGQMPMVTSLTLGGTLRPDEIQIQIQPDAKEGMSSHMLISPKKKDMDTRVGNEVFQSIFETGAYGVLEIYPDDATLEKYGLKEPYSTMTVAYGDKGEKLTFRASDPAKGMVYLMMDDRPVIYQMVYPSANTELTYSWVTATLQDVSSRLLLLPNIATVKNLKIDIPGKSYSFDLSQSGEGEDAEISSVSCQGKELDLEVFKKFYQVVIGIMSDELTDEVPQSEKLITYTYTYTDPAKSPDVVEIYKGSARKALVVVNGEPQCLIRDVYIDKVYSDCVKVLNGEAIVTSW